MKSLRNLALRHFVRIPPIFRFESLERIHLDNFHISSLDSLLGAAPRLKELYLKGKIKEPGVQSIKMECGTLELLKIEELGEVRDVLVKKEKPSSELIVLKGDSKVKVFVNEI